MAENGDDKVHEGIEHLQAAAREMIQATRSLLDAAEELLLPVALRERPDVDERAAVEIRGAGNRGTAALGVDKACRGDVLFFLRNLHSKRVDEHERQV